MLHTIQIIKRFKKIFFNDNILNKKKDNKKNNIILLEFFNYYPSLIGFGYFLEVLKKIKNAKVVCYHAKLNNNFKNQYFKIFSKVSIIGRLFQAIGVNEFLFIKENIPKLILTKQLKIINKKIKTKHDVINLKCFGVDVGQETYDEYLRTYNKTEVDIYDKNFNLILIQMISIVYYWKTYFLNNNIKAVIISHPVYFMGLIARVAIKFNTPVYCVAAQSFSLINASNPSKHSSCKKFPSAFQKISRKKKDFIKLAKKELELRFQGNKDKKALLDQKVETKLFDNRISLEKIIKDHNKINILVAAHCFSDAVHAYGNSFYTDFHDWLTFLGRVSLNLKYKFYIKIHPAQYDLNYKHFKEFEKKYNFTILSKDLTVNHMFKEKFDYIFTVYGSVGHEYPLYNIPVINASNNGPHCAYGFNVNPKNRKSYEKLVLKLKKNEFKSTLKQKKKIFEFYFMRYLSEYSLLDNWNVYIKKLGKKYDSIKIIEHFVRNYDIKSHQKKIIDLEYFVKSQSIKLLADNSKKISKLLTYVK